MLNRSFKRRLVISLYVFEILFSTQRKSSRSRLSAHHEISLGVLATSLYREDSVQFRAKTQFVLHDCLIIRGGVCCLCLLIAIYLDCFVVNIEVFYQYNERT